MIPLRPLGVGEILDGAVSYVRANPRATLGISAIVITAVQVVTLAAQLVFFRDLLRLDQLGPRPSSSAVAEVLGGSLVLLLVSMVLALIASTILNGLLIVVLSRAVRGQRISAREAWAHARPRLGGLLLLSFLLLLILLVVFAVLAIPAFVAVAAGADGVGGGLAVLGVLAAFVVAIYVWVTFALAAPAYVLEWVGVTEALSRSRQLVRTRWWPVFGILLLAAVLAGLIGTIIGIPFSFIGGGISVALGLDTNAFAASSAVALSIAAIGTILAGTITAPFSAGVTGLLYFDQRMRREGLDLELAWTADREPPPSGPSSGSPPGQTW